MIKIVVNTISVKKKSGGAFQIAFNFIRATLLYPVKGIEWFYITSTDVDLQVGSLFRAEKEKHYFVFPTQPDFRNTYKHVALKLRKWEELYSPDVIYSISSPCYFAFKTREVMRFANAWVTSPNRYAWKSLSYCEKLRMWIYCMNQRRLLRKANYIITQSETVRQGLLKITKLSMKQIEVIPNVLPEVIKMQPIEPRIIEDGWIDIACIAAPVPHKNLNIIPFVLQILKQRYGMEYVRFHVTIPLDTQIWRKMYKHAIIFNVGNQIINHGYCAQDKLAEIYRSCQICFLPTLLETFSATLLEAAYFRLNVIATDFSFNKEILQDAALYYEPANAISAAEKIALLIEDDSLKANLLAKIEDRISLYSDYKSYFYKTVDFLKKTTL